MALEKRSLRKPSAHTRDSMPSSELWISLPADTEPPASLPPVIPSSGSSAADLAADVTDREGTRCSKPSLVSDDQARAQLELVVGRAHRKSVKDRERARKASRGRPSGPLQVDYPRGLGETLRASVRRRYRRTLSADRRRGARVCALALLAGVTLVAYTLAVLYIISQTTAAPADTGAQPATTPYLGDINSTKSGINTTAQRYTEV